MSNLKSLFLKKNHLKDIMRHTILAWLFMVGVEYFLLPEPIRGLEGMDGLAQMSFGRVIVLTICFSFILCVISCYVNIVEIERWGMSIVFCVLATGTLVVSITNTYLAACVLLLAVFIIYGIRGWNGDDNRIMLGKEKSKFYWIIIILSVDFFIFVSVWTVSRIYCFSTPTYDFSIFAQMFYNMKECGLPMTTVERDGLLSHFAVHVSPIYYLLLPFYCIFPVPATLQILQALVITSAVIPLWKIGKNHGLSEGERILICGMLFLFPAFSGGTSYDIHENCFLTPLILWILYGVDKKDSLLTVVSVILTLMVKEDAAVYVAVIALWLIVKTVLYHQEENKKDLVTGIIMLMVSVGWFLIVTTYLAESGDGVMTYRYSNFMYDGSASLFTVVKVIIMNPMKVLYECVDAEKLKFIAMTMMPLLGLPLITRKYERYILLIPYILLNLMSDYTYQHDIFFQYTFGSTAFLFYLTVVNIRDIKTKWKRLLVLGVTTGISIFFFYMTVVPVAVRYPIQAVKYYDYYQSIREMLDKIPEDASVTATTFYTTHLSQREVLYDVRYCSKEHLLETEYIVLKVGADNECYRYASKDMDNGYENLLKLLESQGYEKYGELNQVIVIYKKMS